MKKNKSINLLVALSMSASSVFMTQNSYATIDDTGTDKLNPPVVDKKLNPQTVDEKTAKLIFDKASRQDLDKQAVFQEIMKVYLQDPSLAPKRAKMFRENIDTLQRMIEIQKSYLNKTLEDYRKKYGKKDQTEDIIVNVEVYTMYVTSFLSIPLGIRLRTIDRQGGSISQAADESNLLSRTKNNLGEKVFNKKNISIARNINGIVILASFAGLLLTEVLFSNTEQQNLSLKQIKAMKSNLDLYSQQLSQLSQMNDQLLQVANIQKAMQQVESK